MKYQAFLIFAFLAGQTFAQESSTTSNEAGSLSASSTTEVIKVEPKESKVGFLAVSQMEVAGNDLRDRKDRAAVATVGAVGMTYKLDSETKIGLRQYFSYMKDSDKGDAYETLNPTLTYSKKIKSFLGSDEFSPLLWYYIPTSEKSRAENSNGKVRLTAYINWTLNPKWTATYFLDPRQTFNPESDKGYSKTTWIHGGSLAYNFSDKFSIYQGIGTTEDLKTTSLSLEDETVDISTGMYITVGPVLFIPDVTNSVATRGGGAVPRGRSYSSALYRAEEIKYSLSMLANF